MELRRFLYYETGKIFQFSKECLDIYQALQK